MTNAQLITHFLGLSPTDQEHLLETLTAIHGFANKKVGSKPDQAKLADPAKHLGRPFGSKNKKKLLNYSSQAEPAQRVLIGDVLVTLAGKATADTDDIQTNLEGYDPVEGD